MKSQPTFQSTSFISVKVNRAGIPNGLAKSEKKRYFPKREFHGLVLHTGNVKFCYNILSEGKKHIMEKGNLLYLPKDIEYEVYPVSEVTHTQDLQSCMYINFDADTDTSCESMMYTVKNFSLFRRLFTQSIEAHGGVLSSVPGSSEQLSALLYTLISEAKKELFDMSLSYGSKKKILPALEHISTNPVLNTPVTELAGMCGLKPAYFRKCFKLATGTSPVEYRNNAKINLAIGYISSGKLSLQEIATACGIEDYYYFCRLFKNVTGVPPGQYMDSI